MELCTIEAATEVVMAKVDHVTADVLAYVLDTHEDTAFLQLKALLAPFGLQHFTRTAGLMNGILRRGNIPLVNVIPKKIEGNIELSHSLSAWGETPSLS